MDRAVCRRGATRHPTDVELVTGPLRGVLQAHDREAMAALTAFAEASGWRLAA